MWVGRVGYVSIDMTMKSITIRFKLLSKTKFSHLYLDLSKYKFCQLHSLTCFIEHTLFYFKLCSFSTREGMLVSCSLLYHAA
jgi:hypothetical protein